MAAVVAHVESGLHEHANGRRERHASSAASNARVSNAGRGCIRLARDNTGYIWNLYLTQI